MNTFASLQRGYTTIVGISSCLASILLVLYVNTHGLSFDMLFGCLYVALGILAFYLGFWGSDYACRMFSFFHGLMFCIIALLGWIFPHLGGLELFTPPHPFIHTVIGVIGVAVGNVSVNMHFFSKHSLKQI